MKFSKVIVVLSFITVLTYTAVHLYFSWHDKFIPDYSRCADVFFLWNVCGGVVCFGRDKD